MTREAFDRAITYHEREEQRMQRLLNRWWTGFNGTAKAYAEAAYAHRAALLHLRALFETPAEAAAAPPIIEGGAGHNFERGCGAEEYDSDVRLFGFHAPVGDHLDGGAAQ